MSEATEGGLRVSINPITVTPMKTNTSLRIFKISALVPLAIAVAAPLVTQSAVAHSLVLIEVSSTTLTATYDGSALVPVNNGPDNWTLTLANSITFGRGLDQTQWVEPDNSSLWNAVTSATSGPGMPTTFDFRSDIPPFIGFTARPDGSTVQDFGFDASDQASVSITFTDNAATAEHPAVPDTGSSLGLLFLSVIGLFGLNRLRQVQSV